MTDHDDIEPAHGASPTEHVLSELQLFGYRPFDDQPDPRPIPEGKMIAGAVADIFDALTANDRPYKKAVPIDRAIDILEYSVRDGHLDGELVRIFREARVWESAASVVTATK